jgi:hypothetical protein
MLAGGGHVDRAQLVLPNISHATNLMPSTIAADDMELRYCRSLLSISPVSQVTNHSREYDCRHTAHARLRQEENKSLIDANGTIKPFSVVESCTVFSPRTSFALPRRRPSICISDKARRNRDTDSHFKTGYGCIYGG